MQMQLELFSLLFKKSVYALSKVIKPVLTVTNPTENSINYSFSFKKILEHFHSFF